MKDLIRHPIFPFAAPFVLFMLLLAARDLHEHAVYLTYPITVFAVGLTIGYIWHRLPPVRFTRPLASTLLGLAGTVLWVGLYPWLGKSNPDPSEGFNPGLFESTAIQWGLIAFRMAGFVLVVPIMEEIFWRGFLQRFLVNEDFEKVDLGHFTLFSFAATTGMFVLAHADQWGVALLWGTLAGWWFIRTKSLGDVILLHAVTNLALGIYVLVTKKWYFW
ncbi:MAG: CAAX prenyl protease-related protein [Candidatus Methylacidiphilales bacterium]|nr:CAAX prenyl protease-related protein [Candidatus Methylacidiphilales bacterium]